MMVFPTVRRGIAFYSSIFHSCKCNKTHNTASERNTCNLRESDIFFQLAYSKQSKANYRRQNILEKKRQENDKPTEFTFRLVVPNSVSGQPASFLIKTDSNISLSILEGVIYRKNWYSWAFTSLSPVQHTSQVFNEQKLHSTLLKI